MLKCDFEFKYKQFNLHANFEMHGQVLAIVGASGSGKSTVLKNIVGLLTPQNGEISFKDKILFNHQENINIPMHKRYIALIFQKPLLFPHLNVLQNLKYAEKRVSDIHCKLSFANVIDLLELHPLLNRRIDYLSGGEAQRVSIGRAILSSPNLLLLDEPLTGLDTRLKKQILPFLRDIKEHTNIPMVYVTHHLDELDYLDAEVIEVVNGRVYA